MIPRCDFCQSIIDGEPVYICTPAPLDRTLLITAFRTCAECMPPNKRGDTTGTSAEMARYMESREAKRAGFTKINLI